MNKYNLEQHIGYKKALVVFIDVLGTRDSNFRTLYKISTLFHKELIRVKSSQEFCEKYVISFSDCAYIIYKIKKDKNKDAFNLYLNNALVDLSYTISTLLLNGYLCRGGIHYGDYFHEYNNNFIFGPAINNAYKLEKEAEMPRIVLSDKLGFEYYKKEGKFIRSNDEDFKRLIRIDSYNRFFINNLYVFSQLNDNEYANAEHFNEKIYLEDKKYSFNEYYKKCSGILMKKSASVKSGNDNQRCNIIAKYNWQLKYLEKFKEERELYYGVK